MRVYSSFKDIDKDLKILKLQTEIDKEEIRLSMDHTKQQMTPMSLLGSGVGSIVHKILSIRAVSKIMGIKRTDIDHNL